MNCREIQNAKLCQDVMTPNWHNKGVMTPNWQLIRRCYDDSACKVKGEIMHFNTLEPVGEVLSFDPESSSSSPPTPLASEDSGRISVEAFRATAYRCSPFSIDPPSAQPPLSHSGHWNLLKAQ